MGDKYRRLKVTPAMAQYLHDIEEGRENLIPAKDPEDLFRQILGKNWRKKYKVNEEDDSDEKRR